MILDSNSNIGAETSPSLLGGDSPVDGMPAMLRDSGSETRGDEVINRGFDAFNRKYGLSCVEMIAINQHEAALKVRTEIENSGERLVDCTLQKVVEVIQDLLSRHGRVNGAA